MAKEPQWSRLAWQGIAFDVPADWCPGQLQGDWDTGYLRVEDELNVRLELRWETLGRRTATASALVDNFLRQTQKKLRRGEAQPQVVRDRSVPQLSAHDHEVFTWRGSYHAHSLMLVCGDTRRVVHLRVFFEPGNELKSLTRHVFASATSGARDGLAEWNVFDFVFRLAPDWRLQTSGLKTGCLQLAFRDGRDDLEVTRFSLAEIVLRRAPMDEWFRGQFAKALKGFRTTLAEEAYREHASLRCTGMLRARSRPFGLLRRRRYVTARLWHCPECDKLFAVRLVGDVPDDSRVDAIADTVVCHGHEE
ncbi:MAG: hypothetical protein ISS72_00305 [Candidatus Brocadiae bacterium]|nr:hypothetical protein [Candidatus Brocadiia bacterium]